MEGEKNRILLDAVEMTDSDALHLYLREQMCLPDYYGNNFDALYDVLTDIAYPTQIVLKNSRYLEKFGWFGRQILRVFREAAEDNCCLEFFEENGAVEQPESTVSKVTGRASDQYSEKGEEE